MHIYIIYITRIGSKSQLVATTNNSSAGSAAASLHTAGGRFHGAKTSTTLGDAEALPIVLNSILFSEVANV